MAQYYIELFFQRDNSKGQFYIRGLYLKARLKSIESHNKLLKAEEMIASLSKSLSYVSEALKIISDNKQKYGFLIYNASFCVYNIIRPMFKPSL